MKHYKKLQQNRFWKQPKKVITVDDLQKKIDEETRMRNNAFFVGKDGKGGGDSERWASGVLSLQISLEPQRTKDTKVASQLSAGTRHYTTLH